MLLYYCYTFKLIWVMTDKSVGFRNIRPRASQGADPFGPARVRTDVVARWGGRQLILRQGFIPVATTFLWHGSRMGLKPVEVLLLVHLMSYRWSTEAARPSYTKLSSRLGISVVHCRRLMRSLEHRGFVKRSEERGGNSSFDLEPLFGRLAESIEAADAAARQEVSQG